MAMNPMQRKIRNSFLFGFLVAVIIAAVVIALLYMRVKGLKEEIVKIQKSQEVALTKVFAVTKEVQKDETLTQSAEETDDSKKKIEVISVPSQQVPENAVTPDNIKELFAIDPESDTPEYEMTAKLNLSVNTVLTTDMVEKSSKSGTFRMAEYTMISLPSKLKQGDYVDIRIAYPTSADFVVLSKVKVQDANTNTIWLKLAESQILLLNNAILESYIVEGTKIYATQYIDAAQAELNSTYIPNATVASLIQANNFTEYDQSILDDANNDVMDIRKYIDSVLAKYTDDEKTSKVNEGFTTEKTTIQAAREALMGDLGY